MNENESATAHSMFNRSELLGLEFTSSENGSLIFPR